MAQIFNKQFKANLPKAKADAEEFGKSKKGIVLCDQCRSVYYKKSWHQQLDGYKGSKQDREVSIKFSLCPACAMIKNRQYEGRLSISNVPAKQAGELEHLIKNFCERARRVDPLDRLIEIKKSGARWEVTTTENQLANKLARKIKSVFNHVTTRARFAKEPSDVVEITINFEQV